MIISKKSATILLLLLLTLSGCDASDKTPKKARSIPAQRVEVITASLDSVSREQTITGTLEAATIVHLYNEVSGRITSLPYHEGDSVKQGTVIIELDDDLIQAEMEKAKALQKQASLDLQRLKKLIPKNLASEEELTRAKTELEIAMAEEKLQQTLLSKTVVSAAFDGVITERHYEPGDVVPMHSHILTLIDPSSLQIKIYLSENWLPMISQQSAVEITIDALGSSTHTGYITRIHPTIDPNTRKGVIEVSLQPQPEGAKAGQLARIKIQSTPVERLLVPAYAVRHDFNGAYVFVIDDNNKAIKTYVTKGLQFGNRMEITEGLQVGQNVVSKGFTALRNGISVEIIPHNDNQNA